MFQNKQTKKQTKNRIGFGHYWIRFLFWAVKVAGRKGGGMATCLCTGGLTTGLINFEL